MAHDEASEDTGDLDAVVPITVAGRAPRDFAIGLTQSQAARTVAGDAHGRKSSDPASGDRPARSDDVASSLVADETGHVVGHDRLADVVASFGSTLDTIRAAQVHQRRHNLPTGSSTNQKRIAQVVQATPVAATDVVELIGANKATTERLFLETQSPTAGRGDVIFPGRLRMPGGTRRHVELRVYPTASGNLTVLELLPRRSWMPQTRRYLRAGVPAITMLSDAIEAAAEATPSSAD